MKSIRLFGLVLLTGILVMSIQTVFSYACEPGYTPGFWKHNIGVALGENSGKYSAFRDGTKLTYPMLKGYADEIPVTLQNAYDALTAKGPGSADTRRDMANAFNIAAGYGPYED